MTPPEANTSTRHRILAASFYLGVAPFWHFWARLLASPLQHHLRQSLALFSMLFGVIALFCLTVFIISYAMVYHREFFEAQQLESFALTWMRRIFLCWLVFWGFGLALSLLQSTREMPMVWRIASSKMLLNATAAALLLVYVLAATAAALALHAKNITAQHGEFPKVVMLYDDVDRYPAWLFHLGFYRIITAGHSTWGAGAVSVEKITPDRINQAVQQAHFLFLGTHGQAQGILIDGGHFKPRDITSPADVRRLQYVYLAGCDSGAQREEWEAAFAPAEVKTYDRLSAIVEHLWWLWVDGPKIVRNLRGTAHSPLQTGQNL